jgi:hypothetical protein
MIKKEVASKNFFGNPFAWREKVIILKVLKEYYFKWVL